MAIRALAAVQTEAGAQYLDVCAGTSTEKEYETLAGLLGEVQESSPLPICIDSPDPEMLLRVLPLIRRPGILNSVSGEGKKCETLFPFLSRNPDWKVIALTCDDGGIPADSEKKTQIALALIEKAGGYGIAPERIFIDHWCCPWRP